MLRRILLKAGASLEGLSEEQISDLLVRFRMDTDFLAEFFKMKNIKIRCPLSIIISKEDLFTPNYQEAKTLWENYAEDVRGVSFIESSSHYFQSEHADMLVKMIFSALDA